MLQFSITPRSAPCKGHTPLWAFNLCMHVASCNGEPGLTDGGTSEGTEEVDWRCFTDPHTLSALTAKLIIVYLLAGASGRC